MSGNRKLGKRTDQRKAMLRAMVTYLLENGQIKTTLARAKEVAPLTEKMITLSKKNDLAAYRQALAFITKEDVAHKLFTEMNQKYMSRDGGYTRIVRMGPRKGDAAEMAIIQLVSEAVAAGLFAIPKHNKMAMCPLTAARPENYSAWAGALRVAPGGKLC